MKVKWSNLVNLMPEERIDRRKRQHSLRALSLRFDESKQKQIRARRKEHYEKNRDRILSAQAACVKKLRERDPERVRSKHRRWMKKYPEKVRMNWKMMRARRTAQKQSSPGSFSAADVRGLFGLQKGMCAVCRDSIKSGYHVDHIVPLSRGGSNDRLNIQLLCQPCNNSKYCKDPVDFMRERGFLL